MIIIPQLPRFDKTCRLSIDLRTTNLWGHNMLYIDGEIRTTNGIDNWSKAHSLLVDVDSIDNLIDALERFKKLISLK
jgi:hypothetical protein